MGAKETITDKVFIKLAEHAFFKFKIKLDFISDYFYVFFFELLPDFWKGKVGLSV